jgi:replicative DNA helicase
LTGVTASGAGKNVGTYSVVAAGMDTNYNLTLINGTLTIADVAQVNVSSANAVAYAKFIAEAVVVNASASLASVSSRGGLASTNNKDVSVAISHSSNEESADDPSE